MNNIATSLVESYMYADMYNHEGGDSNAPERIHVGGAPVNYMVSSLNIDDATDDQTNGGGDKKPTGKLANKVVPAGLVVIQIRREPNVEFEEQCHSREVVPHELFDRLFESVMQKSNPRYKEVHGKTPRKRVLNKKRSRKST